MASRKIDLGVSKLVLKQRKKHGKKLDLAGSITEATLTRSMEQASVLSIQLADPHFDIMTSGMLDTDVDGRFDRLDAVLDGKYSFRLVGVEVSDGTSLTLTMESLPVAQMRALKNPPIKKKRTDSYTAVHFVRDLIRDAKKNDVAVKLYAPPHKLKISHPKIDDSDSDGGDDQPTHGTSGGGTNVAIAFDFLTGKGLTDYQAAGAIGGMMFESNMNPTAVNPNGGAYGIAQWLGGRKTALQSRANYSRLSVQLDFLWSELQGAEGTTYRNLKAASSLDQAILVWARDFERAEALFIAERTGPAKRVLDKYGGSSSGGGGGGGGNGDTETENDFNYRRQKGEDTWTCLQRIASERKFRCWEDRGWIIYIDERSLYDSKPAYVFYGPAWRKGQSADILNFSYTWDRGHKVGEFTATVMAERYAVQPGACIDLVGFAAADGRWVVSATERSLYSDQASITLKKAMRPGTELKAGTTSPSGDGDSDNADDGGSGGGGVRDKIVDLAKRSMTVNTGFSRYSQAGALTTDPTPATARTDCSQWVYAIYSQAGAGDPGTWTGDMYNKSKPTSHLKPGDIVLYGSPPGHHVELYVGPGDKTIGHGSAPIDYSVVGSGARRTYDFLDE